MQPPARLRIFLSCSRVDHLAARPRAPRAAAAERLRALLVPTATCRSAPETTKIFEENYKKAAVVLVALLVARQPCAGGGSAAIATMAREDKKVVIPVYFEPELPAETFPAKLNFLKKLQGVTLGSVDGEAQLIGGWRRSPRRGASRVPKSRPPLPPGRRCASRGSPSKICACSRAARLEVSANTPLVLLAGDICGRQIDPAAGDRALGLCRESDSAALLKESSGRMIRRGATEATIALEARAAGRDRESQNRHPAAGRLGRRRDRSRKEVSPEPFLGNRFSWAPTVPAAAGRRRPGHAPLFGLRRGALPLQRRRQPAESELVLLRQGRSSAPTSSAGCCRS